MANSQFSLCWEAHKSNICMGLSSLQQNGEFVDMTIAADGYHVKVHQVIMALASPYLKDLIASAQCPHPVIFLNKISYTTLSGILEYIYMGEVQVSIENLKELVDAGKELHIKGLEDMKLNQRRSFEKQKQEYVINEEPLGDETEILDECSFLNESDPNAENYTVYIQNNLNENDSNEPVTKADVKNYSMRETLDESASEEMDMQNDDAPAPKIKITPSIMGRKMLSKKSPEPEVGVMQYTVSTQGSLQMILNRFLYYLKHSKRDGSRHWRCVDYLSLRCPALVLTKDDVVIQRISAHVHTFHDKKILKKIHLGSIFSEINEALEKRHCKKGRKVDAEQTEQLQME